MLRLYVKSRPYLMAAGVMLVAWFNLWVQFRSVPWFDVPGEVYERFLKVSPEATEEELKAKADNEDSLAAYFYALRHTSYCPKDLLIKVEPTIAFKYMEKAARGGRPRAMAVVSLYYLKGIGIVKSREKALEWAEKAAQQRQPMAHRVLGEIHLAQAESNYSSDQTSGFSPSAVAQDRTERLRRSADYEKESKLAEYHLLKAIELGDIGALRILGMAYDEGQIGLIPNHRIALAYLSRAALKGDAVAAASISLRYTAEKHALRELKLSYAWKLVELRLSKDREKTLLELRELGLRLNLAEKLAGQDQAEQWLAQMPSADDSARARLDPDR